MMIRFIGAMGTDHNVTDTFAAMYNFDDFFVVSTHLLPFHDESDKCGPILTSWLLSEKSSQTGSCGLVAPW